MADPAAGPSVPPPAELEVKRIEHQRTRLMAMSFDSAASPSIVLKGLEERSDERETPYGWGFAWYPGEAPCAQVVKDPTSIGANPMTRLLADWERFESTVFVCHLRGAARSLREQDTHPFVRSYAGRDWILAHNGDLLGDLESNLPIALPTLEPMGSTDSERAFCWLLSQLAEARTRTLAEVGWQRLHQWFRHLDQFGTANFLITDGVDLCAYSDQEGYNGLHFARFVPPHADLRFVAPDIEIDLEDIVDRTRTMAVVGTQPFAYGRWSAMHGGQLLVLRRGTVVYDSHANESERQRIVAPVPPIPSQAAEQKNHAPSPERSESAMQVPGRGLVMGSPLAPRMPSNPPPAATGTPSALPNDPKTPRAPALTLEDRSQLLPGTRTLSLVHDTIYRYAAPVLQSKHLFRLRPVHDDEQTVLAHETFVSVDGLRRDYEDVFGNRITRTELETPYSELRITSRAIVRLSGEPPRHLHSPQRRFTIPLVWMPWQRQMMLPYLLPPELPETQLAELYEYAMSFVERQDRDLVQTLLDMNQTIYRDYRYVSGSTTLETTPFDVYCNRRGVCQDFANLLICLARLLGIPARYRVGYIYTGAGYENKVQSEASHAWAELYLPWTGWQGFDPTNGILAGRDHIRVACGRNYRDATPTSGTIYKGGGRETLVVDVRVEELS